MASAAGPVDYVALGDSYSSGTGAGAYTNSSCQRTNAAYPALYASAAKVASFSFVACGGATTSTVSTKQLGTLTAATDLVTITVGGNDIGFGNAMTTCTLQSPAACATAVNKSTATATKSLPAKLDAIYAKIKAKAPNAKLVVLGYPELYPATPKGMCGFMQAPSQVTLNNATVILNGVLAAAAARAGATYADVTEDFDGHELCSTSTAFVTGINFAAIGSSYHPTAAGQKSGYLAGLVGAIG
ncbi:lipase [Nakamurella sp. YIM 132087]|uniref:Lipase n=2 Tax=Nakamurella alba TaxID=2665158 RepID=A0A7K1FL28_9ACTN|nr:lipase [Nakamurella alba]